MLWSYISRLVLVATQYAVEEASPYSKNKTVNVSSFSTNLIVNIKIRELLDLILPGILTLSQTCQILLFNCETKKFLPVNIGLGVHKALYCEH